MRSAVGLLNEMTDGFNFLSQDDRANYYGLLLTPLLREIAPAPYKLGAIGAPQPGSGKTLLAGILRIIHGGVFRSEMPEDGAEMRKQISTILEVTTGPVVHFDNVTGILRSSVLAGLLTSGWWDDRKLGTMEEMISRPNDRLWIITGNNLQLGGDLPRRTLWVTIDPGMPDPHLRTGFAIKNLEEWVRERRGQLIAALLTLVRAWVVAGRLTEERSSDGYSRWISTVDGILTVAGVPGQFDAKNTARQEVGLDDEEWHDFLATAHRVFGDRSWTVKELLAKVDTDGNQFDPGPIPLDALPGELTAKLRSQAPVTGLAKSLGRWLMNRDGRWANGLTVRTSGKNREGVKQWYVDVASAGFEGFAGFDSVPHARKDGVSKVQSAERNPANHANPAPSRPGTTPASPALCHVCSQGMDPYLTARGQTTHPGCAA